MPFIDVDEPYAASPKIRSVSASPLDGVSVEPDHGYLDLRDVELAAADLPSDVDEFDLTGCVLQGIEFPAGAILEARNCRFVQCDLSQVRVRRLENTALNGCKLVGTDLSDARLTDVEFAQCLIRYANLRMAQLLRVSFNGSSLDDVDFYEATLADCSFEGSTLMKVMCSGVSWRKADLRGAKSLGLVQITDLEGAVISDAQVIELAYVLALRVSADIEAAEPLLD